MNMFETKMMQIPLPIHVLTKALAHVTDGHLWLDIEGNRAILVMKDRIHNPAMRYNDGWSDDLIGKQDPIRIDIQSKAKYEIILPYELLTDMLDVLQSYRDMITPPILFVELPVHGGNNAEITVYQYDDINGGMEKIIDVNVEVNTPLPLPKQISTTIKFKVDPSDWDSDQNERLGSLIVLINELLLNDSDDEIEISYQYEGREHI